MIHQNQDPAMEPATVCNHSGRALDLARALRGKISMANSVLRGPGVGPPDQANKNGQPCLLDDMAEHCEILEQCLVGFDLLESSLGEPRHWPKSVENTATFGETMAFAARTTSGGKMAGPNRHPRVEENLKRRLADLDREREELLSQLG